MRLVPSSLAGLPLLLLAGCGPKQAGEGCAKDGDCVPGLVSSGEACVDAAKVTKERAKRITELVQRYMHENKGDCPGGIDELRSSASIADAWGREFRIRCPGQNFVVDIISSGPDGKPDTADDVFNYDPGELQ